MFLFVMVPNGIQHDRVSVPNILPWLSGLGIMLGLKSVNVLHPLMPVTRLALGSLDFNTQVPDTGTATPSRRRLTESQRLAHLAKKRALW